MSLPLDTELAEKKQPKELSAANASGSLASLLDEVVWRTPGCSDLERRKALCDAARDFCDRTNCWQEPVQWPGEPPGCVGHYPVKMPNGAVALRIRENNNWMTGTSCGGVEFPACTRFWTGGGSIRGLRSCAAGLRFR